MKRSIYAFATAAVGIGTVVATPTADAAFTTTCVGEGGAVTVPGDLRVPADESCSLNGTTITGDVTVAPGADFIAQGATIEGRVVARADAWVDLDQSTVAGPVRLVDAYGYYGENVQLADGAVAVRNDESQPEGMFLSFDSTIDRRVRATTGDVAIEGTTVNGHVIGRGAMSLDVVDSLVEGNLRALDITEGSIVCDSEVYGNGLFRANEGPVQLGGSGEFGDCLSANYWDGNVVIRGNAAGISIVDNIVRGNLAGNRNNPEPTGEVNRVRGNRGGQFRELEPTAERDAAPTSAPSSRTFDEASVEDDRRGELDREAEERRAAAIAQASEAGPANL